MRDKLVLRFLGFLETIKYILEQSHGVPPVSVALDHTTLTRIIHQPKKSTRENPFGGQMILTTLISQDHHAPKARSSDGLDSVQSGLNVVSRRTSSWQPPRADHHRFVRDPPEVSMALTGPATSDAPTLTTLHSALRPARLGTTRATKSGSVLEPLARGHPVSVSAIGSWPS